MAMPTPIPPVRSLAVRILREAIDLAQTTAVTVAETRTCSAAHAPGYCQPTLARDVTSPWNWTVGFG